LGGGSIAVTPRSRLTAVTGRSALRRRPLSVTYLNPEGIHKPVDNMYAHVAVATGTKIIRIGGQVAVDARGGNVELENMAGQIRACY
jgi:hypothetical protein